MPKFYGYELGWRATGFEVVRRARKQYECDGCLVDSDAVGNDVELSPGTGDSVLAGYSEDCAGEIEAGQIYVSVEMSGSEVLEIYETYRHTMRTCLPCALHFETIKEAGIKADPPM